MQNFPIYYKLGYLFKIDSPAKYIQVSNDPSEMLIVFWNKPHWDYTADIITKGEEITKEEFEKAFTEVQSWVCRKSFLDATEPATEQDKKDSEDTCYAEDVAHELFERNHDYLEALNELR